MILGKKMNNLPLLKVSLNIVIVGGYPVIHYKNVFGSKTIFFIVSRLNEIFLRCQLDFLYVSFL